MQQIREKRVRIRIIPTGRGFRCILTSYLSVFGPIRVKRAAVGVVGECCYADEVGSS